MLLWITRAIFIVIIVAVLLANLTAKDISGEASRANFYVILWSALGLGVVTFLIDIMTPKKSLANARNRGRSPHNWFRKLSP